MGAAYSFSETEMRIAHDAASQVSKCIPGTLAPISNSSLLEYR